MIVTALLMGVALKGNQPLSDAEIRVRAMGLGMVDGDSRRLTDGRDPQEPGPLSPDGTGLSGAPDGTSEPTPAAPAPTAEPAGTAAPTASPSPTPTPDPLKPLPMTTLKPPQTTESPTPEPVASIPTPEDPESVTFVIQKGQSSDTVSRGLAEVGLVEDASEFDQYLQTNRYAGTIHAGTFQIPINATQEEIAKIITGRR